MTRLPRLRYSPRWLMIAVAILGLLLGVLGYVRFLNHEGSPHAATFYLIQRSIGMAAGALTFGIAAYVRLLRPDGFGGGRPHRDEASGQTSEPE